MIASEGERYLSKIDNWFFSGYYSRKRKRRVPGYKGKVEDLKREIAIASKAIWWWRHYDNQWEHTRKEHKGTVYYMRVPFQKTEDFVKVDGSYGRPISWNDKRWLLVVKFENALEAFRFLPEWGFKKTIREGLGQAIVDANIGMMWTKE